MRLDRLSIHGVLRFNEPLIIDFRTLPPGLIVLVGENGEGKSTALETPLAALYREFPSRSHKELVDYAHDRDAYLSAEFALDGRGHYVATVNLDGVRRLSEAVLVHCGADGTMTPLNDGKVSTFDQAVATVFPPKTVLLASAFAAQNKRGSFVTCTRAERRALFAAFIGLEHYEQMAQTAKAAAGQMEAAHGRVVVVRDVLAQDAGPEVDTRLEDDAEQLADQIRLVTIERERLSGQIAEAEAALATVQDQVAAYAVATQRVQSLEREFAARTADLSSLIASLAAVDTALAADVQRRRDACNHALVQLDAKRAKSGRTKVDEQAAEVKAVSAKVADIDSRIAGNRDVLAKADQIRAAVKRATEIETAIADYRRTEAGYREDIANLDAHDRDVLVPGVAAAKRAQQDLELAQMNAALLGTVPCGGMGSFSACKFLGNAKTAADRIPGLQDAAKPLAELEADRQQNATVRAGVKQALDGLATNIAVLEREKASLVPTLKLEPVLAAAEARLKELTQHRDEVERASAAVMLAAEARANERVAELDDERHAAETALHDSLEDLKVRARGQREGLTERADATKAVVRDLADQVDAAKVALDATAKGNQQAAEFQATLTLLRGQWDRTTGDVSRIEAGQQDLQRQRDALCKRRADLFDVEQRLATVDTELVEWQLLSKALARDGLPTLEIDAAGPTVSSMTNDLLAACGWSRFSVELATQEAKVTGKGVKETFEIKVWDAERGGDARDLLDLSGGEQVIVNECLCNALSIYVNTRSATPIRTCWRDETTSALGASNAALYPTLLRKAHELGGYHQTLVITHNPDVAAVADAQIRFMDGKATVALPPYGD